jgi:hypothetical protein
MAGLFILATQYINERHYVSPAGGGGPLQRAGGGYFQIYDI